MDNSTNNPGGHCNNAKNRDTKADSRGGPLASIPERQPFESEANHSNYAQTNAIENLVKRAGTAKETEVSVWQWLIMVWSPLRTEK